MTMLLLAGMALTGCKTDDESDLLIGGGDQSDAPITLNEICSSGTDWVELYNSSDREISLAGYILQDDKGADGQYLFPASAKIGPKAFLVLVKGEDFDFGISGSGEAITLLNGDGMVDRINVPALENGETYGRSVDGAGEWKVFTKDTKGASNSSEHEEEPSVPDDPKPAKARVVVNEIMSSPKKGDSDFIELYNAGDADADISGYILQDDKGEEEEFVIPAKTIIPAKGFLVFTAKEENSFSFGLSSKGDKVVLLDKERKVVESIDVPGMDEKGNSYARTTDGGSAWAVTTTPTKGKPN